MGKEVTVGGSGSSAVPMVLPSNEKKLDVEMVRNKASSRNEHGIQEMALKFLALMAEAEEIEDQGTPYVFSNTAVPVGVQAARE